MLGSYPAKQRNPLRQYTIAFEVISCDWSGWSKKRKTGRKCVFIKPVHHQFLHSFHRVVKFFLRRISPDVGFPHFRGNETQEIIDYLDLVINGKRSFRKVTEKRSHVFAKWFRTPGFHLLEELLEVERRVLILAWRL